RVVEIGAHRERDVRGEGPRGRRPREEARARLARDREAHEDRRIVDRLVALADLARGEGRAALRPPPDDLVALVEQALLEHLRERPPLALDVALVEGHVRRVEIDPEADPRRHALPLLDVAEDRVDALPAEGLDAVGL